MSRGPVWTKKDEKVLLNQVRKNPNNLAKAFRNTSRLLGRSAKACQDRWYSKFSNCSPDNIEAICFTTLSSKTMTINSKNSKKVKNYKTKSIWEKLKEFIKKAL